MTKPIFISHPIYRSSSYGVGHPLTIPRVSLATDLMHALGWLDSTNYIESRQASIAELTNFHDIDYVQALISAEASTPSEADKIRYNFGTNGNPIYPEMFRRPATACGGGLMAAALLMSGKADCIFNIAGGQHHGLAGKASGFCYLNEPVLTIQNLLERGARRVFYLDIDAHFGDGTQLAFQEESRVFTLSIHEHGRWPQSRNIKPGDLGTVEDRAGGAARNLPVHKGLNDTEFNYLVDNVALPIISFFSPDVIYLQCGADALFDDPQSKLELSNRALWRVVKQLKKLAIPLLVSGGGGYNPFSVSRCWAGVWAQMNNTQIPNVMDPKAEALLRNVTWDHRKGRMPPDQWYVRLADVSNTGPIRDGIFDIAEKALKN
jgi:acetoin utilization protein AcuC